ncbi:MAG: hypothetical protein OXU88_06695 [Gammaproteobacteria bacterium]|nr:hypothetical protein [Gammaproteobacteria bacterium]
MDIFILILVAVVLLVVGCVFWAKNNAEQERQNLERQNAVAESYVAQANRNGGLPAVDTNLMLKRGEAAFYSAPTTLFETRAVRHHVAGHGGVRVTRGVWIGGTRGKAESHQEWRRIDDGSLTVTNQRIIFDGRKTNRAVPLDKLISFDIGVGKVEISVSNRQKSMVFTAGEQASVLGSIIKICSNAINTGAPYLPAPGQR